MLSSSISGSCASRLRRPARRLCTNSRRISTTAEPSAAAPEYRDGSDPQASLANKISAPRAPAFVDVPPLELTQSSCVSGDDGNDRQVVGVLSAQVRRTISRSSRRPLVAESRRRRGGVDGNVIPVVGGHSRSRDRLPQRGKTLPAGAVSVNRTKKTTERAERNDGALKLRECPGGQ